MDTSLQFEANAKPLDLSGKKKHAIKKKPTRRGRWVQSKKGGSCSKFSILGNNSNGLKAKLKSLKAAVKVFNPTCITIQESKLRQEHLIQLPGYVIFENQTIGHRLKIWNLF